MTSTTAIIWIIGLLLSPFVLFLCAKLVTYGVLVGRRRFEQHYPSAKGMKDEGRDSERA